MYIAYLNWTIRRSQLPRGLRRRSATARLLRSWVRIPPGAWMFVCCECCVLSGRGLCDELITHPEESYRMWCVVVCDLETSRMRRPWPALSRSATEKRKRTIQHKPMTSSRSVQSHPCTLVLGRSSARISAMTLAILNLTYRRSFTHTSKPTKQPELPLLIPTWYTIFFYINYITLSSSTCFERHPLIFRRSMMLIVHVCSLWYSHSLQVAVLCTC